MKNLIIAFALALVAILVSFFLLMAAGVDKATAGSVVAVIVGVIPYIHTTLESRRQPPGDRRVSSRIVSLEGYGLSFRRLTVYGVLLMFAAIQFSAMLSGLVAGVIGVGLAQAGQVSLVMVFFIVLPLTFLIGRWMGTRAAARGIAAVIAAAILARLASTLFDLATIPDKEFAMIFGEEKEAGFLVTQVAIGSCLLSVLGLLGYWRGRRRRLSAYLVHLLRGIPQDAREAIIDLAYEEARSRATPRDR